ncbi:MAG: VRR-NUC domain-containing protein [Gammaproteobacteria bacterium]|nr:VRR-NUC domain-containing protein [Gammaproteobacteria bacterium]
MKESDIQNLIRLTLSERSEVTHWRNNTGSGWQSNELLRGPRRCVDMNPGDVLLRNARPLHAGLCKGSSDLIGMKSVEITQEMVGQRVAVFVAVEVKNKGGRVTKEQQHFGDTVLNAGGIFAIARSPADVEGL